MLQLKTYKIKLEEKFCIRVNTKKLDEVPVTKCLPYIHLAYSPYYTKPSLP